MEYRTPVHPQDPEQPDPSVPTPAEEDARMFGVLDGIEWVGTGWTFIIATAIFILVVLAVVFL